MEFLAYTALLRGKEEVGPLHFYYLELYDQVVVVVFTENSRGWCSAVFEFPYRDVKTKPTRERRTR